MKTKQKPEIGPLAVTAYYLIAIVVMAAIITAGLAIFY